MLLTNGQQLLPLFYGIGYGMWIGMAYAILLAWRRIRRTTAWIKFWQDIVFALISGIGFFLMLLPITGGAIRLSVLASAAVGCTVSYRLAHRPALTITAVVFRATATADRILRRLWTSLALFLQNSCKKALFFSKKGLQSAFYMLYNKKRT